METATVTGILTTLDGSGWAAQNASVNCINLSSGATRQLVHLQLFRKVKSTTEPTDDEKEALISTLSGAGWSWSSIQVNQVYDHINSTTAPGLAIQIYQA